MIDPPPADVRDSGPQKGLVVVVGAGLMGVGVAQVFARAGHEVRLVDSAAECRERAPLRLNEQLEFLVSHGLLGADQARAARGRVSVVRDLESAVLPAPQLVLEAISEDLEAKRGLLADLDRLTPPETVLASNTSGLSITGLAEGINAPERVCGAHFWNPPHLIPLVEVVCGARTSPGAVKTMCRLLREAGKEPVVVRNDVPGFIGNRLLHALQREAMALVSAGVASAADVDLVVTAGFGRRLGVVGPLAVCDLAGLDLVRDVDSYLLRDLDRSTEPSPLLEDLVARGDLGVKSGRGFHEWSPRTIERTIARRDAALLRALQDGGDGQE